MIEHAVDDLIDLLVVQGLLTERDAFALRAEVHDDDPAEALEVLGRAVAAGPRGPDHEHDGPPRAAETIEEGTVGVPRDWNTEERVHSLKVAAALQIMTALRPAVAGSVSWAGHLPEAVAVPGSPEFNEAVAAYEQAKDDRDAFLDERRRDDPGWR